MTRYRFVHADRCNMCGAESEQLRFFGRRLDGRQGLWPRSKTGITVSIVRCSVCSLIFPNPMPVPETLGEHYDVAPEAYWTESAYFEDSANDLSETIETFSRLSQRAPKQCSALDIGSGLGKAMAALSRAGFDVSGIEPSASFRRAAIERSGIPQDRLMLASVENAEMRAGSFDFINLSAVLEHVGNPAAVLRKTVEWLKPGGLMYVEVPSSAWLLSALMRIFYRLTGSDCVINTSPMHPPYHLYEFGLESFVRDGRRGGYAVAAHRYHPCATYLPPWLSAPADRLMRYTDTGMQLVVWLKRCE